MFCLNDTMRYFLCPGMTDMRKGMNSLCGMVRERMGQDVRFGDVFIFINRSRNTIKLLHAEDGGLVLYIKRLEEGRFRIPEYDHTTRSYPMQWRDLVIMVEGISENPALRLKRLKGMRNYV
jgi:transposase